MGLVVHLDHQAHEQEPTVQHLPNQAGVAHYAAHLADLHSRLADVRGWADSARKAALIEEYEEQIEEFQSSLNEAMERDEIGAEHAEVIEERDEQAEEMGRVCEDLQARTGWAVRSSRMLILTTFGPRGGSIDAVALQDGRWLVQVAHSDRIATIIIAGGELLDVMIAEMRGVEALGEHAPHDWTSAYSADFPY